VEKETEFETVWDHGITEEETVILFGFDTTKEEYLSLGEDEVALREMLLSLRIDPADVEKRIAHGKSQRKHYERIYDLYSIRGNKEMAQKYLDKIPNDVDKIFSLMNHDCIRKY
jgi:hypothetical protein